MVVQNIGRDGRWVSETNAQGQVTISSAELELPVSATASLAEYTTTTFERLTVENATIIMLPLVPPMGEGEMEPIEPVTLRGRVLGLNQVENPTKRDTYSSLVERTHSSPETVSVHRHHCPMDYSLKMVPSKLLLNRVVCSGRHCRLRPRSAKAGGVRSGAF